MSKLKKFLITFLSFFPLTAGAIAPLAIGALGGGTIILGVSIFRSAVPVDMSDAFSFFSSCWTCGLFNDIMLVISNILPKIYHTIGVVCVPVAAALTAVYFAWEIVKSYLGMDGKPTSPDAWQLSGKFGATIVKLVLITSLLMMPLPRMITDIFIGPVFNVGLSFNHVIDGKFTAGTDDEFAYETCLVATAFADPSTADSTAAKMGAFSPKLRHNLACQVGQVHQMTGLGMTAGWTMLNMAFNEEHMYHIFGGIPIFPNVMIFLAGFLILVVYFFALLPVPLYFLETFIQLGMNLVMLPLNLLAWLFADPITGKSWMVFPDGKKNIKGLIDNVIQNTLGIAMVGIFTTFSLLFMSAAFGKWQGADALALAFANNDSAILMDALTLNNDSMIAVIMMGIFLALFMNSIPTLAKTLFGDVTIPNGAEKKAKELGKKVWSNTKEWWKKLGK
ncbi:MAG: hypothetical protein LBL75_01080 [Rickettsiales bacterium]|jgi:hypothetical protein|nr:hypothetical protein [Rickettsiales bacterium]